MTRPDGADAAAVGAYVRRLALRDAWRWLPSVVLRAGAVSVVGAVAGLPVAEAVALGLAASLALGLVQVVRQTAIVETLK